LTAGSDYLEVLTESIKKFAPELPIICGGPYASDSPQHLLNNHKHVDFCCSNEGEVSFTKFLESFILENNKGYRSVHGIGYRIGDAIFVNPAMPFIEDIDELPIPDYAAIDLKEYAMVENPMRIPNGRIWAPIMTQRGCPYRCTYCHEGFGKKSREMSARRTVDLIKYLHYEHEVEHFAVLDDIFNVKRDRAKQVMQEIIKSGMKIQFSFPNGLRGDTMDEELVDLMVEAGTICIHYAVETASPRLQKWVKKNLRMDTISKIINYTAKYDIILRGFYMVGFPSETKEELKATIDHAINSGFSETYFSILSIWPGTKIYDEAVRDGFIHEGHFTTMTTHDYKEDNGFHYDIDFLVSERTRGYAETHFSVERFTKNLRVYRKLGMDVSRIMEKEAKYASLIDDSSRQLGVSPAVPDAYLYNTMLSLSSGRLSMPKAIEEVYKYLEMHGYNRDSMFIDQKKALAGGGKTYILN